MYNVTKIGKSCSPSTIISHEIVKAVKVLVSYGGGMGGTSKTYYCSQFIGSDGFNTLILISGEIIQVNNKFIVEYKRINLVKVVSDITEHLNYHKYTCKNCISTHYYELSFNDTYELIENNVLYQEDKCVLRYSVTEK